MSTSVKRGDSSTGLWGDLHEVMSVGSPAPEVLENPWPLCQYVYLENGGIDVSWWARLTLPCGDEDPVRAGCDPGKPGLGALQVRVLMLFWKKREAVGGGQGGVVLLVPLWAS